MLLLAIHLPRLEFYLDTLIKIQKMHHKKKPDWLKIKLSGGKQYIELKNLVEKNNLHTICTSGKCPNIAECWNRGAATFMILGDICTRQCKFCATKTGKPNPIDLHEPSNLAKAIKSMNIKHAVITSVDRDDLIDKGANHWANTIEEIKKINPTTIVEVLLPDFDAQPELIKIVANAQPNIISHNIETVKRITPLVRNKAKYNVSLETLKLFSNYNSNIKSGLMVGLGETISEVYETIEDLYSVGCQFLTIGQYLQPTKTNFEVVEYISPEQFTDYKNFALKTGFKIVESAPLVRSSYMAENSYLNFI